MACHFPRDLGGWVSGPPEGGGWVLTFVNDDLGQRLAGWLVYRNGIDIDLGRGYCWMLCCWSSIIFLGWRGLDSGICSRGSLWYVSYLAVP